MPEKQRSILYWGREDFHNMRLQEELHLQNISMVITQAIATAMERLQDDHCIMIFYDDPKGPAAMTELLKGFRQARPLIPIVAVLTHVDDALYGRILDAGVTQIVQLPAPVRLLRHQIEEAEKAWRLNRQVTGLQKDKAALETRLKTAISAEEHTLIQVGMIALFDRDLAQHAARVGDIVKRFCKALEMPEGVSEYLILAANLHDMGMLHLDPMLLRKNVNTLTEKEQKTLQRHVEYGEKVVSFFKAVNVGKIIRHHHEHIDGTGYPDGLKGDQIPLGSRILAVVDGWDEFQYGHIPSVDENEQAEAYLKRQAGHIYDPKLVASFLKIADELPKAQDRKRRIEADKLKTGMIVAQDIVDDHGQIILRRGEALSTEMLAKLRQQRGEDLAEDVLVLKPMTQAFTKVTAQELMKYLKK